MRDVGGRRTLLTFAAGIKEVQIIQWFVKPGTRVAQFDKLCEVASDKAVVEITSRFDGVVRALHHEPDGVARVGQPLCDIDIQSEISPADEALLKPTAQVSADTEAEPAAEHTPVKSYGGDTLDVDPRATEAPCEVAAKGRKLATPAVRGLLKEFSLKIEDVEGTGQDGRVLKVDVERHEAASTRSRLSAQPSQQPAAQQEKEAPLTPVQVAMFKTMTQSLAVPHFLFTDDVNLTALDALRGQMNAELGTAKNPASPMPKLTYLPFILKAVSCALGAYPLLNARLTTTNPSDSSSAGPRLIYRPQHNINIAINSPHGLLVPVLPSVQSHTLTSLAAAIQDLTQRARANKLAPADLAGGTLTVSNIGALGVGGTTVAPILYPSQLAILGIGAARDVPRFDAEGRVVRRRVASFCWSADHRVGDGATVARAAGRVRELLEEPGRLVAEGMRTSTAT